MGYRYCAYLRKSRADSENRSASDAEILARHERLLVETARRRGVASSAVYREVVSGDSISARPEMQRLLSDVMAGKWDGVFAVEVTRLARGDTIDQGVVAQVFKYSGTKIITPDRVYNPSSDSDEEYFEFGLFMSRREYKMINQRQQRGRLASVQEGKWASNKAPYGYIRVKLDRQKGWTLRPNEHAPVVQDIFRWFTGTDAPPIGVSRIVRRLNESGIPSPAGGVWTNSVVRGLLSNPTYAGFVRWGNRAMKKTYRDGHLTISRPRARPGEAMLFPSLHPAIVEKGVFDLAQAQLSKNSSRPGPKQVAMKNPLSGLIICADCGRAMVRRPYQSGRQDTLICPYTDCHNVGSNLSDVERTLLDSMRLWLAEFERCSDAAPNGREELESIRRTISEHEKALETLSSQLNRAYDLVEQGVYTSDVFLARSRSIADKQEYHNEKIRSLEQELSDRELVASSRDEIAPKMRHVLDAYPLASSPEEKNALLKSVLEKVLYKKTQRDRWGGNGMQLELFPLLPHF